MKMIKQYLKNSFKIKTAVTILALNALVALPLSATAAEDLLKPFYLAQVTSGTIKEQAVKTKKQLTQGGFEVVGEYSPYASVLILLVTNKELSEAAKKTPYGVFGVLQRVTLTQVNKDVQIAYTNPTYYSHAYRMKSDLAGVSSALQKTLGMKQSFGSEKGVSTEKLRDYQYKWLMPYFYDRLSLAEYKTNAEALAGVEKALKAGKGATSKIARVDIAGTKSSLFAVSMKGSSDETKCSGDNYIMNKIDFKDLHSTGHLPYEIAVVDNKVFALPAEFRIAISFPDLSMMGDNSFASIMCSPSAIETALTFAAGGTMEEDE